jgi:hypothetical protein
MKKLVFMVLFVLVLAAFSAAQEQAQEVEEDEPGFFAKLFSFFKAEPQPKEVRVASVSTAEEAESDAEVTSAEEAELTVYEGPVESGSVEGYEGVEVETVEAIAVRPMPKPVPEPMPPIQVEPQRCEANICYNKWQQEVYCTADFKSCERKYDNCRVVSCNPPRPQPYDCPSCTCPEPIPIPTPVCREEVHLCVQMVPADDGTDIASYEQVKCEGSYEDCSEKFLKCQCGLPEPAPSTCEEEVHTCKKVVYSGDEDDPSSTVSVMLVKCEGTFEECKEKYDSCACGLV